MSNVAPILIEYVTILNVAILYVYYYVYCAFVNVNFVFAERNIIYHKSKQIKYLLSNVCIKINFLDPLSYLYSNKTMKFQYVQF